MPYGGRVIDHMQAIRAFVRVVEIGGFARAAESLQIPNATRDASKRIPERALDLGGYRGIESRMALTLSSRTAEALFPQL
jgi:hypothetical protein